MLTKNDVKLFNFKDFHCKDFNMEDICKTLEELAFEEYTENTVLHSI